MKNKRTAAAFALSLLLLAGCGRGKPKPDAAEKTASVQSGAVTEDGMLTCIFSKQETEFPADSRTPYPVTPYCDPETGAFTVPVMKRQSGESPSFSADLCTFSADGTHIETQSVPLPDTFFTIYNGAVTADAFFWYDGTREASALYRFDRVTEEVASTGLREDFFGHYAFDLLYVIADAEGRIYCSDRESVVILDNALNPIADFAFPSPVSSMARGSDGAVWTVFRSGGRI